MFIDPMLQDLGALELVSPVAGVRIPVAQVGSEVPPHRHPQGQLVLVVKGSATCDVEDAIWMAPPNCAVWIPGGLEHSIRVTANAEVLYLFVQSGIARLPDYCCTLALSPLVRELIQYMADQPDGYAQDSPTGRKAGVLIEDLAAMPVEKLHLPLSSEPRLRRMAQMLSDDPSDRRTAQEWARSLGLSERSLARLVRQETGLTYGRWRRQLHLIVAMRELSAGEPVQRVAERLGYESVTAFITMFKKALGSPPARYFAELQARRAGRTY